MVELIAKYGMYGEEKTLRSLDLSYAEVGPRGATALGKALSMPDCILKDLVMIESYIGEEAVSQLALGLRHNTSLKLLRIECYPIGSDAVKAIGKMLTTNQGLESLMVDLDKGVLRYLTEGLKHNTTLTHLCIGCIGLEREDVSHLADLSVANTALSHLELDRVFIEPHIMKDLEQMMENPDSTIKTLEFTCCSRRKYFDYRIEKNCPIQEEEEDVQEEGNREK